MTEDPPWPSIFISYGQVISIEIASKCDFEKHGTYEGKIDHYSENDYSYIPFPSEREYYNLESDTVEEIDEEQWIWLENPVIPEMEKLEEYEFLLIYDPDLREESRFHVTEEGIEMVSYKSDVDSYVRPNKVLEDWPGFSDELFDILKRHESLYIITLADLNGRQLRAVLYHLVSGIEVILSSAIKETNPHGEPLLKRMNETSVGRWKKAEFEAGQLHPVEYAYFGELKHIAATSPEVLDLIGYESREKFERDLRGVDDLRNKVMHPTKNLVSDRESLADLNRKIRKLESLIEKCGGEIDKRR